MKRQLHFWEMEEPDPPRKGRKMADDTTTAETTAPEKATASNGQARKAPKKAAKKVPVSKASAKKTTESPVKQPVARKAKKPSAKKKVGKKREKVTRRPFPQNTLEEALTIPMAIKDKNKGKPFDTEEVAKACKLSRYADPFFYLAGSSRDYGLTEGSRDKPTIALTELGKSIVYPDSAEQQRADKIKAFFNVKLFKDVYDNYNGGKLPEKEFVSALLFKKFDLDESLHDEFCDLYQKNCNYLGITDGKDALKVVKREGDDGAVVLEQAGEYSHHAFIIMPFSEKGKEVRPAGFFEEVLSSLITPACNAADFGVQTAHSHGSDLIHHTIIRQLDEADLVVADLTDHNPNVLFELGLRIALDKPVLLIRAKGTPPIFDVDNMMRVCEYDPRLWKRTIQPDISTMTDHVKGAWENKDKNPSYIGILKTGQAVQSGAMAAAAT